MSARDRARDLARVARKQIKGKSPDQAARWLRGYFLVAASKDPDINQYKTLFMDEAQS